MTGFEITEMTAEHPHEDGFTTAPAVPAPVGRDETGDAADDSLTGNGSELFDGDAGTLSIDQRLCLIALLKNTFISSVEHVTHWQTLIADDLIIKGRLNDMLLDLVIDAEREVAYKVQVREADGVRNVPPLIRSITYTREETVLMIFLRSRYTSERAEGREHVWVEREEMLAHVENLRPEHATDKSGDAKRAASAITTLVRAHILQGQPEADSFRISPVIEALLPVSELQALSRWFAAENAESGDD